MKLIWSTTSPFARKVRIVALELGLHDRFTLEAAEVRPGKYDDAYSQDINPLRKLPALILDSGDMLVDSFTICDYLDGLAGGARLIPASGDARARVLTQHAVASGMTEALVLLRYETMLRPAELRWPLWCDDQWERARQSLSWFETRIPESKYALNLGTIALGCALGYLDLRYADRPWRSDFPKLARFFDGIGARASFVQTAPPAA